MIHDSEGSGGTEQQQPTEAGASSTVPSDKLRNYVGGIALIHQSIIDQCAIVDHGVNWDASRVGAINDICWAVSCVEPATHQYRGSNLCRFHAALRHFRERCWIVDVFGIEVPDDRDLA